MKHKKEKKEKKTSGGLLQRQRPLASSSAAASAAQDASAQSAYRWEKLSPAEFEQLQDLSACEYNFHRYFSFN
jgi:hypothetical protein